MTHSVFKKQALDSNKREQLITTDSSEIPLTDIKTVEILPIQRQETSSAPFPKCNRSKAWSMRLQKRPFYKDFQYLIFLVRERMIGKGQKDVNRSYVLNLSVIPNIITYLSQITIRSKNSKPA